MFPLSEKREFWSNFLFKTIEIIVIIYKELNILFLSFSTHARQNFDPS